MNLTNIGLWLILIAMIALIPCGCIMTRPRAKQEDGPSTTASIHPFTNGAQTKEAEEPLQQLHQFMGKLKLVWLPVGHPDNPFPYEVLDCRPVALSLLSATSDRSVAATFAQLRFSDGRELRGQTPKGAIAAPGEVRIEGRYTLDGPLFVAPEMEHKWDLFAYDRRLYARRSWGGELIHTAAITTLADQVVLDDIQTNQYQYDVLDEIEFLMTWYVARKPFPFSVPNAFLERKVSDASKDTAVIDDDMLIALWGWTAHGRIAQFGRRMSGIKT